MGKQSVIHLNHDYYSTIKKNLVGIHATAWENHEIIMLIQEPVVNDYVA